MKYWALLLTLASTLALTPHSPVFTENDASGGISVASGETFFLALQNGGQTGYSWTENGGDSKVIAYEGSVRQNGASGAAGAPAQQIFIFHANRSGTTQITMTYSSALDSSAAPRTLVYTITVQ